MPESYIPLADPALQILSTCFLKNQSSQAQPSHPIIQALSFKPRAGTSSAWLASGLVTALLGLAARADHGTPLFAFVCGTL